MRGRHIVVIEPDEAQRHLYEWELSDDGYEVTSYSDPSDMAEPGRTPTGDLVIVDAGCSESTALDRVCQVNRAFPHTPVVAHTVSYALASDPPASLGAAFLLKRSDLASLRDTIRSLLSHPGDLEAVEH